MTTADFKKTGRLLKEAYSLLEKEAISSGVDIFSSEFKEAQDKIREGLLKELGYTLEEYRSAKEQTNKERVDAILNREVTPAIEEAKRRLDELQIMTPNEVADIAHTVAMDVAKQFIVPPQVTNQIVKEVIVERPIITKETKEIITREEYDDKPLMAEIDSLNERFASFPKINEEELRGKLTEEAETLFGKLLKHNIDILGMPDFRKLAMGLDSRISTLESTPSSSSGASFLAATGTVNGSNTSFTFTSAPSIIYVDGVAKQKTASDSSVNWSGTTSVSLTIAPNFDIFGL